MQPFHFPPMPPRFMPHPPPPCPPGNPFPTLDTEPTAKRSELYAEIARAMAAESGIVESAVTAATESVTAAVSGIAETSASAIEEMRASVTAAVSGANAAAARAERVVQDATLRDRVSGIASAAAATAVGNLFSSGGLADQVASRAVYGVVDSAVEALQSTYATKGEIRAKANKSYVDACLKQAVVMTQSPDGLSQIQIGNDGVPKVVVSRPFKAIWTDSNSVEHKFSWDATDGSDSVGTPEYHYPEDASTATSGREIILREAKNGAYLSVTDAGVTNGIWPNYPVFSGGVFSGNNIVAYNQRVFARNIVLEAAQ